jgi:hypothetical protein
MSEIPGQSGHALPDLQQPVCAKKRHRLARTCARPFYPGLNGAEPRELSVHVGVIRGADNALRIAS